MKVSSYSDKVQAWGVLVENMEPILGEMGHAAEAHTKFKELVETMRLMGERIEVQRSGLRDVALQREALIKSGRKMRNVLAAALQSHFGLESAELLKFGIQPRRERVRRKSKAKRELELLKAEVEKAAQDKAAKDLAAEDAA
jgi:single-stranded DNA-specific DHH superfamily exonuclease